MQVDRLRHCRRCIARRQPRNPGNVATAHRAGDIQSQKPALSGRLDIAEARVERTVERIDQLAHRFPGVLAAHAVPACIGLERRQNRNGMHPRLLQCLGTGQTCSNRLHLLTVLEDAHAGESR